MTTKRRDVKVYNMQDKLFGLTFKSDFRYQENSFFYQIFVRVPDEHNEPDRTYEDIQGFRTVKIAGKGGFKTQALAAEEMLQEIGELLEKVQQSRERS